LDNPTAAQIETILRENPYEYWQRGGGGEAILRDGAGRILSITQPDTGSFFFILLNDWLVPYDGGSCEPLLESEFGGNPFWIPRACLVGLDEAVGITSHFIARSEPWPGVSWRLWHELPLPAGYPHEP
jgi:hypothetical protein